MEVLKVGKIRKKEVLNGGKRAHLLGLLLMLWNLHDYPEMY
jgi:hypothetical protein